LWRNLPGVTDAMRTRLDDVQVAVGNLPGDGLGTLAGDLVLIDSDAAGFGWFVDFTPGESSEFTVEIERDVFTAAPDSQAFGQYDLVSVVAHELGHVLGFDHHDALRFAVMRDELDPGMRYLFGVERPAAEAAAEAAAPSSGGVPAFDFDIGLPGPGLGVGIDWQGNAGGNWGVQLSPYAPVQSVQRASPNVMDFTLLPSQSSASAQDTGFDSLGRALLGKGKPQR
jgi:hypothetical protein